MNLKDIKKLIFFVSKYKIYELKVENNDIKIKIKNKNYLNEISSNIELNTSENKLFNKENCNDIENINKNNLDSKFITIKSPMIGTFYRKPSPDKDPYVKIGEKIKPGKIICIIEAMKLFNDIEAEIHGKIIKIFVDDSTPVEYDQPLFLVEQS